MSVVIKNKLGQKLPVPIADGNGRPSSVELAAYGASQPMPKSAITKHTEKMADQGYIKIREVK